MMVTGRIFREGGSWSAHCDAIGVYTQGDSLKEAMERLADATELKIGRAGTKVTITDLGIVDDAHEVFIDSNEPAMLAAEVLKHQRDMHGLSLADVAKKLGVKSLNAYAAYEQGQREPTLGKFRDLLAVVAPELVLMVRSKR